VLHQKSYVLDGKTGDDLLGATTVGIAADVAELDHVLVGKNLEYLASDG